MPWISSELVLERFVRSAIHPIIGGDSAVAEQVNDEDVDCERRGTHGRVSHVARARVRGAGIEEQEEDGAEKNDPTQGGRAYARRPAAGGIPTSIAAPETMKYDPLNSLAQRVAGKCRRRGVATSPAPAEIAPNRKLT